jgi:hypothetical protein
MAGKGTRDDVFGVLTRIDGVVTFLALLFIGELIIVGLLRAPPQLALLVSIACTLSGALLGFLFAVPKRIRSPQPQSIAPPLPGATGTEKSLGAAARAAHYDANSSLEEISDWLTKIIVGVGLVEAKAIAGALGVAGGAVGVGVYQLPANGASSVVSGVATIIAFAVTGFLISYLWFRQNLMKAWDDSHPDVDPVPAYRFNIAPRALVQSTSFAMSPDDMPAEPALVRAGDGTAPAQETNDALIAAINLKYAELRAGARHPDDWVKGMFGGSPVQANPYREMSATVRPVEGSNYFEVALRFASSNPSASGEIAFFLHNTFAQTTQVARVDSRGEASLRIFAWGAFTVGLLADSGATQLELDLAQLRDAPQEFKAR